MAIQTLLSQRILLNCRSSLLRQDPVANSLRYHIKFTRNATNTSTPAKVAPSKTVLARATPGTVLPTPKALNGSAKKNAFPESLLIFHAGTLRIVNLASLKVVTVFIFAFFTAYVAPTFFYSDEQATWASYVVTLSGIIPMVVVMYISGPFVNFVHLRLPPYARRSREIMMRYVKTLPKDAELVITTMSALGKRRVSAVRIAELSPTRERFGLANYARDVAEINSKRAWWMGKVVRTFGIHPTTSKVPEGDIWNYVAAAIAKNALKKKLD